MKGSPKLINEKDLRNWRLLEDFRALLAGAAEKVPASEQRRPGGPGRKLLESDYLSLFFFGLLNPVVKSMRGLCAASHLTRMQQTFTGKRPNKRAMELIQFYFMGYVDTDELSTLLKLQKKK